MRDLAVLMMLVTALVMALRTPWHGVIWLAIFEYMNPHTYCWGFMVSVPVYQLILMIVFMGLLLSKAEDRQPIPKDWRIPVFYLMWSYFLVTCWDAEIPRVAWPKLIDVSKIYLPLFVTLVLINTREKFMVLLYAMAGSIGLIAFKSGIWAIGTGFSNRVWGPPGTQYGGNNEFAIINLMMIPLLIMWGRETKIPMVRTAMRIVPTICFMAAICSWSRGAFLTAAVLLVMLLWHSKRKWLIAPLMVAGLAVFVQQLPDEYFARMNTIQTYEEDASANARLTAWTDGIRYAFRNPLTGAGFEGWRYVTISDWHSSFVEMMAEHGFISFGMWLSLLVGSIINLTFMIRLGKTHPDLTWVGNVAFALRASFVCYFVGALFLGLSYWSAIYHLVFCAVLLRKFALQHRDELQLNSAAATPLSAMPGNRNLISKPI